MRLSPRATAQTPGKLRSGALVHAVTWRGHEAAPLAERPLRPGVVAAESVVRFVHLCGDPHTAVQKFRREVRAITPYDGVKLGM
jgi:hypothetical protein